MREDVSSNRFDLPVIVHPDDMARRAPKLPRVLIFHLMRNKLLCSSEHLDRISVPDFDQRVTVCRTDRQSPDA